MVIGEQRFTEIAAHGIGNKLSSIHLNFKFVLKLLSTKLTKSVSTDPHHIKCHFFSLN